VKDKTEKENESKRGLQIKVKGTRCINLQDFHHVEGSKSRKEEKEVKRYTDIDL
jgi:hypothetical protein